MGSGRTAIDTETCLIAPGVLAPPLVCATACDDEKKHIFKHDDPDLFPFLAERMSKKTAWANTSYDHAVLMRHDARLIPIVFDSLARGDARDVLTTDKLHDLANGCFRFEEDEEGNIKARGYSLDAVAKRRINRSKYGRWFKHGFFEDNWRLRYHDLRDEPLEKWPKEATYYAIHDAVITHDVDAVQPLHGNEAEQNRAALALHLASCRGLRTDNERVQKLADQCNEWIDKIRPHLLEHELITPEGKRCTKNAVRRMIETLGNECALTTGGEDRIVEAYRDDMDGFMKEAFKKGKYISVSSPNCIESGDDILRMYGVYSKLQNMLSGTVKDLEKGIWLPIQSRFDLLKATGRTGSSKPNVQNQRRGIDLIHPFDASKRLKFTPDPRGCFKAREGYALVAADISGAENHTLAQTTYKLFGHSKMRDALLGGMDMHLWVASIILRCSYEEAVRRYEMGDPEAKDARQLAKVANFGFPGGCGVLRFVAFAKAFGVEIDAFTAQRLKKQWLEAWPEMAEYFDYIGNCVDDTGFYWVRHINVDRIRKRATFTAACNSYFQGLAADGAKAALWEVTRRQWCEPTSALAGTYIVNFVHDEIILEVPIANVESAARELREVLVGEFNRYTPDVPVGSTVEAMIYWSKEGDKVFDKNDEFIWKAAA